MLGLLPSKLVWPHGTPSRNTIDFGIPEKSEDGRFLRNEWCWNNIFVDDVISFSDTLCLICVFIILTSLDPSFLVSHESSD
jgi:hypothetical protein